MTKFEESWIYMRYESFEKLLQATSDLVLTFWYSFSYYISLIKKGNDTVQRITNIFHPLG